MEIQRTPSVTPLKYVLLLNWCYNAKPFTKIKHHCLFQTGQSTTWWCKKAAMVKFQSVREAFQWWTTVSRPVETGEAGEAVSPQVFAKSYFWWIENIMLLWKIVQNYKTTPLTFTCSRSAIEKDENMSKGNNKNTKFGVFITNFEHILHLFLGFLLLTSNKEMLAG